MNAAPRHRQAGASLIEVLVSILIVSFGLLALAASQTAASRMQKNSELRSVAILLASDLADRMRANPQALALGTYPYELTGTYSALGNTDVSACPGTPPTCNATTLAAWDMSEWKRALFYALPGAAAYVKRDTANSAVDVWIMWQDSGSVETTKDATGTETLSDTNPAATSECPSAIGSTWTTTNPKPRCLYYRVGVGA